MSSAGRGLPARLRLASVLAIVLAGLCGTMAAWEAFSLARFSELRSARPPLRFAPDPVLAEQLRVSQLDALEQMREPRMVVLFALALACSLAFVASNRLLRPAGVRREDVRRILVWALLGAAVLRTIDGAQVTAVARHASDVLHHGLRVPPGVEGAAAEQLGGALAPAAFMAAAILQTVVVAATFLGLSQYFRSARVRASLEQADGAPR
ncbi:MAG TPA: hypothetical protein VEJ89_17125 [Myxococcaceae bacterium]|nr:hypothetical protein [Myxococcaceae bacterium]